MSDLTEFEGADVTGSRIVITKAGDGLSDALKVEPVELHKGEIVHFILRGRVRKIGFPPAHVEKGEPSVDCVREHVIDTLDIVLVDEAQVGRALDENRERVKRALESVGGQLKVDDPEAHKFEADEDDDPTECIECGAGPDAPWHSDDYRDAKAAD